MWWKQQQVDDWYWCLHSVFACSGFAAALYPFPRNFESMLITVLWLVSFSYGMYHEMLLFCICFEQVL